MYIEQQSACSSQDSRGPHHYAAMASDSKKAKKNYTYLIQKGANENVKDTVS